MVAIPPSPLANSTPLSNAAGEEFWTASQMTAIHKMLNPRSIAVIGATPRLQYGGRLLNSVLRARDRVRIYPVNPKYEEISGLKCYPSVEDLPESPDVEHALTRLYRLQLSVWRTSTSRLSTQAEI